MEIKIPEQTCIESALAQIGPELQALTFEELLAFSNRASNELGLERVSENSLAAYLNLRVSSVVFDREADHLGRTCGELPHGWIGIS